MHMVADVLSCWVLLQATHLVIGTLGVLDEPNQGADVGLAHLDFHFTQTGQWGQYWSRMQVSDSQDHNRSSRSLGDTHASSNTAAGLIFQWSSAHLDRGHISKQHTVGGDFISGGFLNTDMAICAAAESV